MRQWAQCRKVTLSHTALASEPSRPLAVAKSRSAHGNAAAVLPRLFVAAWRDEGKGKLQHSVAEGWSGGSGVPRLRAAAFALKKGDCFKFIALSCGYN